MKHCLAFLFMLCLTFPAIAQQYTLSGTLTDAETGEALIAASVLAGDKGVVTDFDGRYSLVLEKGTYKVVFSYLGYISEEREINLDRNMEISLKLGTNSVILKEVEIVADIAVERETPVAFSNIPTRKLEEELAAQDIPMILNSTPGAYATQAGGGDGDARISIRGFNQRNIAVMLDGIPVNDMENGQVYWSNWFGLDLVTQTMQVQRGLGASKLSIPSIGGTINILTKGIDAKRGLRFRQEVANDGYFRSTLGLTSGRLANGWGFSLAGSYKQGDGWVDGNFTEGYFYYLRIDKQIGNHMISLSGFGAPQQHGQRSFTAEIAQVDASYASELGVPDTAIQALDVRRFNKGRKYNEYWGLRDGKEFNLRKNYYHKPQFSLRHSWQVNDKLFWSNIAYLSIGRGGGTADDGANPEILENGQLDIENTINVVNKANAFSNPLGLSNTIIRSSFNNHFWYGFLSTFQQNLTENWTFSGGIDGRYYRGDHYRQVYDLLGGTGFRSIGNFQIDQRTTILQEGDRYDYDYSGFVRWGGIFGLLEWKKEKWTAFVNVSGATAGYRYEDFMKPKVVELVDTTLFISYSDTIEYNEQVYNISSPEAKNQSSSWINIPSYTFKGGASYKIDKQSSVFINAGYISKAQRYSNVVQINRGQEEGKIFENYDNEKIKALELGYSFGSPKFSANLNTYYTLWENKPLDRPPTVPLDEGDPDGDRIAINIPGVDARHIGLELDFAYKPIRSLSIEGLVSVGDWIWNSAEEALVVIPNVVEYTYDFDAKGVHVGDAAQIQLGGLVRYEPFRGAYIKVNGTYFGKNYANFQPETLRDGDEGRESWQMPNYAIFSLHGGYSFKFQGVRMNVRANVLNLFDTTYITDARNNDTFNTISYSDFDAKSASVHFGQGRRWTMSFQLNF